MCIFHTAVVLTWSFGARTIDIAGSRALAEIPAEILGVSTNSLLIDALSGTFLA